MSIWFVPRAAVMRSEVFYCEQTFETMPTVWFLFCFYQIWIDTLMYGSQ